MKKITWAKFSKALAKNGIVVENTPNYWKDQLHQWNCGNRDARMHDNALSTLSELTYEMEQAEDDREAEAQFHAADERLLRYM